MFIPRHPVVENQFCQLDATTISGGVGNVLAYAGSACYLDDGQADATVKIYAANEDKLCFGFLMQKVKSGYHSLHPAGFMMPGDLGSSDVVAQPAYNSNGQIIGSKPAPVGIAHLGIWDTIHYYSNAALNAATVLGVRQSSLSELSNVNVNGSQTDLAIVMKGASAAQVAANVQNTTLYPIRIKLLY